MQLLAALAFAIPQFVSAGRSTDAARPSVLSVERPVCGALLLRDPPTSPVSFFGEGFLLRRRVVRARGSLRILPDNLQDSADVKSEI